MQLSLKMKTALSQTLTPQQIQYLKLLQLPLVQLEQHVRQEIEQNPLLEEFDNYEASADAEVYGNTTEFENYATKEFQDDHYAAKESRMQEYSDAREMIDDKVDPFEFYKMIWQDDSDTPGHNNRKQNDDDDYEPFQISDSVSFIDEVKNQLAIFDISDEYMIIVDLVLGYINRAGYLIKEDAHHNYDGEAPYPDKYEDLTIEEEITERANEEIFDINLKIKEVELREEEKQKAILEENPARKYALSKDVRDIIDKNLYGKEIDELPEEKSKYLNNVTLKDTEKVIKMIQHLDPPGIASRNIRECLMAQLEVKTKKTPIQELAYSILESAYEAFSMKHYHLITKQFEIDEEDLRLALEEIKKLNPKPAGFESAHEFNTVTPDFLVGKDEKTGELIVVVNDSRLPTLKVNEAYNKIRQDAKYKKTKRDEAESEIKNLPTPDEFGSNKSLNINREAINWIRTKYEDAKFLIQAIKQRKSTMLKVMTAIAYRQKEFFDIGSQGIKPLIYKDVSDDTGLDISTICRIVNGKFVQTEFGTFELKYFFSEALLNDDGEEVSTRVIKEILKETIDAESKDKPLSDEKLSEVLKEKGYNVARRTVAKYREQMNIPVARLRKEI